MRKTDPLLENSSHTVFRLVLPQVAGQTNVAAELKDNNDNNNDHGRTTTTTNLEVLDGLLPVASETVNDAGGETVHKPAI